MDKNSLLILPTVAVLAIAVWMIFAGFPILIWDEAIYANNAVEMSESGKLLQLTNNGIQSWYNTKPPLVIWLESLSILFFGVNEFAVRLPSLLACTFLVLSLFTFLKRRNDDMLLPVAAILILLTSCGFLTYHVALTGDLDMILTMWSSLLAFTIFRIIYEEKQTKKLVYLAALFVIAGFLSKSIAVFLPVAGLLLCMLSTPSGRTMLRTRQTCFAVLSVVLFIIIYYLTMESISPGYFRHVWNSEYARYFQNVMPWHEQEAAFYFIFLEDRFYPWIYILPAGILAGLTSKDQTIRRITRFCSIYTVTFLLIISIPDVKLQWYDAPAYPFLAILTGIFFSELKRRISLFFSKTVSSVPVHFILMGLFIFSLHNLYTWNKRDPDPLEREGTALRSLSNTIQNDSLKIYMRTEHPEHLDQLGFYRKKVAKEKGIRTEVYQGPDRFRKGDTILICQRDILRSLPPHQLLEKVSGCFMIYILP